jgi:hypothetical protein
MPVSVHQRAKDFRPPTRALCLTPSSAYSQRWFKPLLDDRPDRQQERNAAALMAPPLLAVDMMAREYTAKSLPPKQYNMVIRFEDKRHRTAYLAYSHTTLSLERPPPYQCEECTSAKMYRSLLLGSAEA